MDRKKAMPLIKSEDELSKCIEILRIKRQEIHEQILKVQKKKKKKNGKNSDERI